MTAEGRGKRTSRATLVAGVLRKSPNSAAFAGGFTSADIFVEAEARSDIWRFHCNGVVENLGGGQSGLSDGRLNRYHGDLINVLYRASVGGQPAIAVYSLDEDSNGIWRG